MNNYKHTSISKLFVTVQLIQHYEICGNLTTNNNKAGISKKLLSKRNNFLSLEAMAEAGDIDDGCVADAPIEEFTREELRIPEIKYEYLDHPADVQLHSWGDTLKEAFEQITVSMFGYMTEIDSVDILMKQDISAEGHDMLSLLYNYLDEFLYIFSAEPYFIARKVEILEFDKENFKIKARGYGEIFDLDKHPQGTEVKAITYSNMQVHENENKCELFVIIDI